MKSGHGGRGGQKRPKMGGRPLYKPPNAMFLKVTTLCVLPIPKSYCRSLHKILEKNSAVKIYRRETNLRNYGTDIFVVERKV